MGTNLQTNQGGTGASTPSAARAALGAAASGANSDILSLAGLTTPLSVEQGGTAATTSFGARSAIGAAASGANSDILSIAGLTTPLSVAQGGTNSTTSSGARSSIEAAASGANSDILSLTGLTTPLSVAQGGTGATTATASFSAIAPTTTKGDLIVHNGTTNVRVPAGTNGQELQADSTEASGVKWVTPAGGGISWVAAPATATSTGVAGEVAYDASYFYVCVATNTWVRAALATW